MKVKLGIIFAVADLLLTQSAVQAFDKQVVAIPDFTVGEGVEPGYAAPLADALATAFETSGRIATKGKDDIRLLLQEMETAQQLGQCKAADACDKQIGMKMNVHYIARGHIARVHNSFAISLRMIRVRAELELPVAQKEVGDAQQILGALKIMGTEIAMVFPLEGEVTATQGNVAFINLGKSYNIEKGDRFFVMKEETVKNTAGKTVYSDRKKIGILLIEEVMATGSKGVIESGKGNFGEKSLVVLDQEELMAKLAEKRRQEAKEREKDLERNKELAADAVAEQASAERLRNFSRYNSFLKFGYGGFGLVQNSDQKLNSAYGPGQAFMLEFLFGNFGSSESSPHNFNFILRGMYRMYEMSAERQAANAFVSKGNIGIMSGDLGMRYITGGLFLRLLWSVYAQVGMRMTYFKESAENNLSNTFYAMGVVGNLGMELALAPGFGIFGEAAYGYTGVGGSKANIDGLQVLFGIILRMEK